LAQIERKASAHRALLRRLLASSSTPLS
jgi:hypothetical protein